MATSAAQFLWEETQFFEDRYEKAASALIATQEILATDTLPVSSGPEFVQLYGAIAALPDAIFTQVWLDPTAYFWARNAYELVQLCLNGEPLPSFFQAYGEAIGRQSTIDILDWHLQDFKRFVLAAYYLENRDLSFLNPYCPRLPLALPGTSLFIAGDIPIKIQGWFQGQLVLQTATQTVQLSPNADTPGAESITMGTCPIVQQGDYTLPLQVYSFNLPAFDDSTPALAAGLAYQSEQIPLVQTALALIRQYHSRTFEQLQRFIRLMAFKPQEAGDYGNLSYSDLPGALICSAIANPYEFAETLIHEFHHNRLFCIEEISPILLTTDRLPDKASAYYSPWRNDPRPLRGILHALYVYTPVCEFWLNLYRSDSLNNSTDERLKDYVSAQLIVLTLQLQIGLDQLGRYGQFSDMGRELFPALAKAVNRLGEAVAALALPGDAPMMVCDRSGKIVHLRDQETNEALSARERVWLHIRTYDIHHQCDHWLDTATLGAVIK